MALNPAAAPHKPQDLARRVAALERRLAAMSSGPNYQVNGQAFRLAQQASADAYDAALTTAIVSGDIGSTTFPTSWTRYDLDAIQVPDGFSRVNVILFAAAGVTLTSSGNVGVQPGLWIDSGDGTEAGYVLGPPITTGAGTGGGPISVSSALGWISPSGFPAGLSLRFGANAVRVGAAQSGSCNVHAAGQVVFQR